MFAEDRFNAATPQGGDQYWHKQTSSACRKALEHAMRTRKVVRIHFGDRESGMDALLDTNVIGIVAKALGSDTPILCPEGILGGSILDDKRVLRIVERDNGRVLYEHPAYRRPNLFIQRRHAGVDPWVVHCLDRKGEPIVKGFTRFESAAHWVAFVSGTTTHKF